MEERIIGRLHDSRTHLPLFVLSFPVALAVVTSCLLSLRLLPNGRGVLEGEEVVVHGATGGCGEKGKGCLGHEGEGQIQGEEARAQLAEG